MSDVILLALFTGMMIPSAVLFTIWWRGGIVFNPARFCRRSGWPYRETPPSGTKEVSVRIFTSLGHHCGDSVFVDKNKLKRWFPRIVRNQKK